MFKLLDLYLFSLAKEWVHGEPCIQIVNLVEECLEFVFCHVLMQYHQSRIRGCHKAIHADAVIESIDCFEVHSLGSPLHLVDRVKCRINDKFVQICLLAGYLRFNQVVNSVFKKWEIVPAYYHKHL